MSDTNERVALLKTELDVKMQDVEIEKEKTNDLIDVVGRESNIAEQEEAAAKTQEEATMVVANEAQAMKAAADKELEQAIPIMEEAKEAVNCLTNKAIVEFKSYQTPPKDADQVTNAVLIMLGERNKNKLNWAAGQKMMNQPAKFIERLQNYDKNNIPE
jgi:dynein heavy chain